MQSGQIRGQSFAMTEARPTRTTATGPPTSSGRASSSTASSGASSSPRRNSPSGASAPGAPVADAEWGRVSTVATSARASPPKNPAPSAACQARNSPNNLNQQTSLRKRARSGRRAACPRELGSDSEIAPTTPQPEASRYSADSDRTRCNPAHTPPQTRREYQTRHSPPSRPPAPCQACARARTSADSPAAAP